MAFAPQFIGEGPHGQKEANDLLHVVRGIVSFLPHLEEAIDDRVVGFFKPRVGGVELVAE